MHAPPARKPPESQGKSHSLPVSEKCLHSQTQQPKTAELLEKTSGKDSFYISSTITTPCIALIAPLICGVTG